MKKKFILILLLFVCRSLFSQTGTVKGTITDEKGVLIPRSTVIVGKTEGITSADGTFEVRSIPFGKGDLIIYVDGIQKKVVPFELNSELLDFGKIAVSITGLDQNDQVRNTEATLTLFDLDENSRTQNVASLLTSSQDVFVSISSYNFSAAYFRMRGYDGEFSEVNFSGISMNDGENNRASYSQWGGLNDATRFKEGTFGLNPSRNGIGTLGGTTSFDIRPSHQRKQTKISYAFSNRTYTHRVIATASTGVLKNGWSFTVSGSKRIGTEAFVEGVFYDSWSYFAAAEKKINDKHSVSFTAFGAPTRRGMQTSSTQEAYDLTGSNYYNPSWGYQNGEVRNSKVKNIHEPVIILSHFFDINKNTKLTTSVGYVFGKDGTTSLNWYNSSDPRPDYYRYLPSYQEDAAIASLYEENWKNNINTQVDWDKLYQINYLSNLAGGQSRYIIEERRTDTKQFTFASIFNQQFNNNLHISAGVEEKIYRGRNYKLLSDLMGGTYWMDVDQFAERDFNGDTIASQNDLNNPNNVIKEGDVFGYDYISAVNKTKIWGLTEFKYAKVDFYGGFNLTYVQYWREGKMKNGRYPEGSFGKSAVTTNLDYVLKGGATYKITGRHYVSANLAYMSLAPSFRNTYVSSRTRDQIIPNFEPRKIASVDLNYDIRYPGVKGRITFFNTTIKDDSEINSFYHDDLRTYVNQVLTKVEKIHQGIEAGLEVKITSTLAIQGAASFTNYQYTSRPQAITSADNGSIPDDTNTIYIKNFYVSGTPQKAYSIGLKYQGPKNWFGNISANYFDDIWIDFNPERRTEDAIANLGIDDPKIDEITRQIKADAQFTIDASIGKSWRIKDYYINLNASVSNILDNQNLITSGYEQMRFDYENKNIDKFPPKYYYGFGRTYFLMLSVRF